MLDERKEQRCFVRGYLLIYMTFMNFPKPGVNFHDFSRPEKKMEFHDFSRFSMTGHTLSIYDLVDTEYLISKLTSHSNTSSFLHGFF